MTETPHISLDEDTPEVADDFSSQIVSLYENLLEQEATPADPDEIIRLGIVKVDSPEWTQLLQAGVAPSTIEAGSVTRKSLLDAGFIFLNKIGGGEKPLIATTIEMEDGSSVDTGQRTLLTDAELQAVQRSQGFFDQAETEQTRLAMIDFLQASKEIMRFEPEIKKVMFKEAQARIIDSGNEENIAVVGKLFQSIAERGDNYKLAFIVDHCVANLVITKIGSIPIDAFSSRSSILRGAPSPFLDSGYHFDTNDDVTIYPGDPKRTKRLNSVVIHLLSRGLNEEGASINGSHDQTYITEKEFKELVESLKESDTDVYDDEMIQTFILRLLENAREETTHMGLPHFG